MYSKSEDKRGMHRKMWLDNITDWTQLSIEDLMDSTHLTYLPFKKLLLVIQRRGHMTKNGTPVDAMLGDTNCLCEGEVDSTQDRI